MYYFASVIVIMGLSMYLALAYSNSTRAQACAALPPIYASECSSSIAESWSTLNRAFLIGGGAGVLFMVIGSAILSNRIAGPVFRAVRYVNAMADGKDADGLRFRKGDYFQELARAINRIKKP
jgi:hypothetical protein